MDLEEIANILTDQKNDIEKKFKDERIIDRELSNKIIPDLNSNIAKVIIGVRRCGKSILCYSLLKEGNFFYVNFDDERLMGIKAKDLNDFLKAHLYLYNKDFDLALIDEPQKIKGWELFVNRLLRRGKSVFVTGSSSQLLSKELATTLTGRHVDFVLYPFSFKEFLAYKGIKTDKEFIYSTEGKSKILNILKNFLDAGAIPQVYKISNKKEFLRNLYDDILTKDIILRYKIKFPETFKIISNFLMKSYSKYMSYNSVRKSFGIKTIHTAREYAKFLENSFLFIFLKKFSWSMKEMENVPKKVYCIDTGMISSLIQVDMGRVMENLVAIELLRRKSYYAPSLGIYYWKDYQQREVDFVVKDGLNVKELIQVCYDIEDLSTKNRELRALIKAGKELKCKNLKVITWDYEGREEFRNREIEFRPLWKWLLEL